MCRSPFFISGWSEKRSYELAVRIMTSSRKTQGEDIDTAGRYSWHFGRRVAMKPAHNKWLHATATVASAPSPLGEPSRYECLVLSAFSPFVSHPGRAGVGWKYALATASSCASTLAVNGRLPAEPGTTCNPYIRVHCTSGDDPNRKYRNLL